MKSTKRSLDELAKQLHVAPIGLSEERLSALTSAGQKMRPVMEFVEFLNNNGFAIVTIGDKVLTDTEMNDLILAFSGVSKEDAEIAANYVINTVNLLQGK